MVVLLLMVVVVLVHLVMPAVVLGSCRCACGPRRAPRSSSGRDRCIMTTATVLGGQRPRRSQEVGGVHQDTAGAARQTTAGGGGGGGEGGGGEGGFALMWHGGCKVGGGRSGAAAKWTLQKFKERANSL